MLWARQTPAPKRPFDWHDSAQLLRVPVIRELFWQLSNPGQLQPLGLNVRKLLTILNSMVRNGECWDPTFASY